MQPPKQRREAGPLQALLVQARDQEPPRGDDDWFEWMPVCSEGEPDAATAHTVTGYYEVRRRIEEFFRLLKSVARLEERQLVSRC